MTHYVCIGGCQGVSNKPGQCQAPNCGDYQKDLKACNCTDGKHEEVMKNANHSHEHKEDNSNE